MKSILGPYEIWDKDLLTETPCTFFMSDIKDVWHYCIALFLSNLFILPAFHPDKNCLREKAATWVVCSSNLTTAHSWYSLTSSKENCWCHGSVLENIFASHFHLVWWESFNFINNQGQQNFLLLHLKLFGNKIKNVNAPQIRNKAWV